MVRFCVAVPELFLAVMVSVKVPRVVGLPAMSAVPSDPAVNVNPLGRAPVLVNFAAGKPVVLTTKLTVDDRAAVKLDGLVNAGRCPTVNTKDC